MCSTPYGKIPYDPDIPARRVCEIVKAAGGMEEGYPGRFIISIDLTSEQQELLLRGHTHHPLTASPATGAIVVNVCAHPLYEGPFVNVGGDVASSCVRVEEPSNRYVHDFCMPEQSAYQLARGMGLVETLTRALEEESRKLQGRRRAA